MAIIEGYWDCPYCGNKGIKGHLQKCPSCGKTRSASTKFYMRETTPVADESVVEKGPDWYCPYCDSYNPHSATHCSNCGHPRESEDKDYFQVRRDEEQKAEEETKREEEFYTPPREEPQETHREPYRPKTYSSNTSFWSSPTPQKKNIPWKRIGIILAILALVGVLIWAVIPKHTTITVEDAAWERTIEVQQYRLVEDNGWSLPSDAVELLRTAREIHHYDQVLDHYQTVTETKSRQVQDGYDTYTTYEDMGNGYFRSVEHQTPRYRTEYYTETHEEPVYRSVPVYETKYYYTIWRWVHERDETVSGQTDPYWPDIVYADDEREGARSDSYSVSGTTAKGKEFSYSCSLDIWEQLEIGGTYEVKARLGSITEILGG